MLFSVGLVFFLTYWLAASLCLGAASDEMERSKDISMLLAAGWGILANAALQTTALRYGHVTIPKDAFVSLYCALLLLGSPMPFFPGDTLFYKISKKARGFMFLALMVSSIWRIGMLIPALFNYVDKDCSRTGVLNDGDLENHYYRVFGATAAGLSTIAAIGIGLASR